MLMAGVKIVFACSQSFQHTNRYIGSATQAQNLFSMSILTDLTKNNKGCSLIKTTGQVQKLLSKIPQVCYTDQTRELSDDAFY